MQLTDIYALLVGLAIGFGFTMLRLPIPAPANLGGILAVIGVGVGGALASFVISSMSR